MLLVAACAFVPETAGAHAVARQSLVAASGTAQACPVAPYGVRRVAPGRRRTVALTFDDGPGPSTKQLITLLRARHVPATFFNIGVQAAANPRVVRAEAAAGFVLGNHTWDHRDLRYLGATAQAREIDRAAAGTRALTGRWPCAFRPPYGDYDTTTLRLARARHLSVWMWSVDTEDWKAQGSGSAYWVHRIVQRAEAGLHQAHPVILFHNMAGCGNLATVRALPAIIRAFTAHGYRFVTLG